MANFKFSRSTTTTMKLAGLLDTDAMTIDIDGAETSLQNMLSVFNGAEVEIVAKIKQDEELEAPAAE